MPAARRSRDLERSHAVQRLPVHLQGKETVRFAAEAAESEETMQEVLAETRVPC